MNINKDDLFYVCTMIEYVSRRTHNKCKDIVAKLEHQLKVAEINHCLPFEQVSDERIEQFGINNGTFDNITSCRYKVPSVTSIGRVYQRLIISVNKDNEDVIKTIKKVYGSFISDEIENYNSSLYYSNPDYIRCSYEAGEILD